MKETCTAEIGLANKPEQTFAPGNLVVGMLFREYSSEFDPKLFSHGITIPTNGVRAVMLDNRDMPGRYLDIEHPGPRGYAHRTSLEGEAGIPPKIAIIVSLTELRVRFPRQVFAVGKAFHNDSLWRHVLGQYHNRFPDYSQYGQFVSGIPVVRINEGTYEQEVRIYPNDPEKAYITPDMWIGVVTNNHRLAGFLEEHNPNLEVPVYNEDALDTPIHLRSLR